LNDNYATSIVSVNKGDRFIPQRFNKRNETIF